MTKALLINGSNTEFSRLTGVQHEVERQLQERGIETETLFVHQLPSNDLILANFGSEAVKHAVSKVEQVDVIVLLTPIFKASFTGILKTFLDLIPQKGFVNKTIVSVAIGGSISHLLAIDYALKPVVTALGATHITQTIFVVDRDVEKLENGKYALNEDIIARIALQTAYIANFHQKTVHV